MPSPILHCAAGVACYCLDRRALGRRARRNLGFIVAASLMPDLDFLPGLLIGDPNRYHCGLTHSIGFAALVALVFGLLCREQRRRVMLWSFVACTSHAALDAMTLDRRPPVGVALFWPLATGRVHLEPALLEGIRHGNDAATTAEFVDGVFSKANAKTMMIEALIGGALILVCVGVSKGAHSRRGKPASVSRTIGDSAPCSTSIIDQGK